MKKKVMGGKQEMVKEGRKSKRKRQSACQRKEDEPLQVKEHGPMWSTTLDGKWKGRKIFQVLQDFEISSITDLLQWEWKPWGYRGVGGREGEGEGSTSQYPAKVHWGWRGGRGGLEQCRGEGH